MREKRWLLLALYGILLADAVSAAVKPTRPKFKIATSSSTTTASSSISTTDEGGVQENEDAEVTTIAAETNGTTGHVLTGIPQIDYIWDPNLPRELNGYNLSDYPFYNSIPEDIDFKCDGLHDGFYASVPHKCQVYHHCLFGTRYDFLCANFTAFDQKTFICHFVSEVDCANSKKYWHRNDALYKAATTSTSSTSTTTTTTTTPVPATAARSQPRDRDPPRRRRPSRRRPAYDYYDEEYYDDEDYGRPRGYGRDEYDYEDRKYRRDRDFRDRDRDFRDRDSPRSRDGTGRDDRDREATVRDRYPGRNNRRDPPRTRDPLEEDTRVRSRDPDQGSRSTSREIDEADFEDRRTESRIRDDDRRYSEKRYRDEYEDKEPAPSNAGTNSDGLVKPAAPVASVYARPRAPPKIRRPVPLSEQDKYAYKANPVQSAVEEPRRRPADLAEDDYYEDELEDPRPVRRPHRRRPTYRDRDRDFYDVRDRERDRPFRTRYRDDEEDSRGRKQPDRLRDRYYDRERGADRGRDRSLDRGKDRVAERPADRDRGRIQDPDKQERPYRLPDRDRDVDRSRPGSRSKDQQDTIDPPPRRVNNNYDRPGRTSTTTTSTTCLPEQLTRRPESSSKEPSSEKEILSDRQNKQPPRAPIEDDDSRRPIQDYRDRDQDERQPNYQPALQEEYSQEYYDESDDPPAPPPRTAVRIVKRPFLPSRGGNPNPRGLFPVGAKASAPKRDEERSTERPQERSQERPKNYYVHEQENARETEEDAGARQRDKDAYRSYKILQPDREQDRRPDEYDSSPIRPAIRRPGERQREEEAPKSVEETFSKESKHAETDQRQSYGEGSTKWSDEDYSSHSQGNQGTVQSQGSPLRSNKGRPAETATVYSAGFNTEDAREQATGPQSYPVKQRINEVTHRLQDIPESEYDVTLNDALTPTLNQETSLPSGFALPLHRQSGRDAIIQSSETSYKVSGDHQQQKPFVPSPQFLPVSNDRPRTVYFRTPESIQIGAAPYRPQRGSWQDYTGY